MTWYVLDKNEYMAAAKQMGVAYREIIGQHYPAMTVWEVSGLLEANARVEIGGHRVVPTDGFSGMGGAVPTLVYLSFMVVYTQPRRLGHKISLRMMLGTPRAVWHRRLRR